MKKLLLVFMLTASALFGQRETILEDNFDNGGFGGPRVKFTSIKGNLGVLVGAYGGWLIDHKFLLGGGGYGLANNIEADKGVQSVLNFYAQPYIDFGYGGVVLEYYFNPDKVLHSSVSVLIGGGGASYRGADNDKKLTASGGSHYDSGDGFFVVEPGLSAELNIAKYFKIGFNVSYRYVNGVDLYGLKNSDFSNVSGGIALKFGVF